MAPPKQSTTSGAKPRGRPPSNASGASGRGSAGGATAAAKKSSRRPAQKRAAPAAPDSDAEEAEEEDEDAQADSDGAAADTRRAKERSANRHKKSRTRQVEDGADGVVDEFASDNDDDENEDDQPRRIPEDLLRRLLHEFFERDGTRISTEASGAVARYFDIFVSEAIARTIAERPGRFLEVEDLEKVTPQLLLDL